MTYVTPVTNHSASSYFNVADWTRIYGNASEVHDLVETELSVVITFTAIDTPTTSTIPTIAMINTLCTNIENIRDAVAGESIEGTTTEITAAWTAGANGTVPDYEDVNLWESTLDAIYQYFQT